MAKSWEVVRNVLTLVAMKTFTAGLAIASCITLLGCNSDTAHRDDHNQTPGEQVGRAAYVAKQDAKKAAKELSQDLKSFRHDAQEGYQEEKQKHEREKANDDHPAPPQ